MLGWLLGSKVEWFLGKVFDRITGGDMLDPDYEFAEDDSLEREADPLHPNEVIRGLVPREAFRTLCGAIHANLDRGFRGHQMEVLQTRAQRLKVGEHCSLLCHMFHAGVTTGVQFSIMRADPDRYVVFLEGRGPTMQVLRRVFREQGVAPDETRDGALHERSDRTGWWARLPEERGQFLGRPLDVSIDRAWPGLAGTGHPADSELLQELLVNPGRALDAAALAFSRFVEPDVLQDLGDVALVFPATAREADEWVLQIVRSDWERFRWLIPFRGLQAGRITAGV